jgi:hypothetical protein
MRCMACGAEMILMQTVQDDTMAVAGFEHHTFMCSDCHDVERRLVFVRPVEQDGIEPVTVHAAPPISPASTAEPVSTAENERAAPPGILMRVFAKLRGERRAATTSMRP